MAGLNVVVNRIYTLLKKSLSNVYNEYEKIPVVGHESVYIVCSVPVIHLENRLFSGDSEFFDAKYNFRLRILASPDTDPVSLYRLLDEKVLGLISASGFEITSVEIRSPYQDNGLKRLVLECTTEILGRTEVSYGA